MKMIIGSMSFVIALIIAAKLGAVAIVIVCILSALIELKIERRR